MQQHNRYNSLKKTELMQ